MDMGVPFIPQLLHYLINTVCWEFSQGLAIPRFHGLQILKEMGIPDHLPASRKICMQVKKQQLELGGTTDWFQIGKGVCQGCILSPCLFNFYVEYIM